jgi:hypothetical protein
VSDAIFVALLVFNAACIAMIAGMVRDVIRARRDLREAEADCRKIVENRTQPADLSSTS